MPRPNKRKKHTTSMNERRSKESLASKDSGQSGSEEDVTIKSDDDIDHINFEDPSVLNDISDLFSFCKQQINTRFISTLVYMSQRHFGHSWRETDDFMKEIGAMTAETSNKWAHVLVNSDLDEFTTDERGGKRGDSFWDNYRDLELEAKDFVFTECSKKESSFTAVRQYPHFMMNTPMLLTDKQVQDFLVDGYLVLRPSSLDGNFHSSIFTQASTIFEKDGNPGNNILPRIPQLQFVFDDPIVSGALESLLGSNYTMQPHRHAHLTKPGSQDQQWHKDSYFGYRKLLRHHQLRYIMAMYYPQDTTMEMGPTAIKPRSQYDVINPEMSRRDDTLENTHAKSDMKNDIALVCTAGTVVLIHYDIVHRGTANRTKNSHRFMFKFQFNRLEEPTRPTWNHDPRNIIYDAADAGLLQPIVKHVWNWMIGNVNTPQQQSVDQNISEWERQLDDRHGEIRLNAAYNLALSNEYNILIKRLYNTNEVFRLEAAYALTACRSNQEAMTELQKVLEKEENNEHQAYCIAFIFSEMGSMASQTLPLLIHIMETSDSSLVKLYCCEALGTIRSNEQHQIDMIVRCLTNVLSDRDQEIDTKDASHTRFTATLSLAKIGAKAVDAIPMLKDALYLDQNRYVNGNALFALEQIGTNEALKIVLSYLKMSRWCTKTTADSLF